MQLRPLLTSAALLLLVPACPEERYLIGVITDAGLPLPWSGSGGNAGNPTPDGGGGVGGRGGGGGSLPGDGGPTPDGPYPVACGLIPAPMPVHPVAISLDHLADRMARFLWGARADAALLVRASSVKDGAGARTLAREMLADVRAERGIWLAFRQWLLLDRQNPAGVDPSLRRAMEAESEAFVRGVMVKGDGRLSTLLTGPFTYIQSTAHALHYGLAATTPQGDDAPVALDPGRYSGILTHPGMLATYTRATARGIHLREVFSCMQVPAPPADVDNTPAPSSPGVTARQRLESRTNPPVCGGCHHLVDGVGFGLEHFDEIGRWRDLDNGGAIDDRGRLVGAGPMPVPDLAFEGAPGLGRALAAACDVHACAVQTLLTQAMGAMVLDGSSLDASSRAELGAAFAHSGYNLRELMIAITGSKSFLSP